MKQISAALVKGVKDAFMSKPALFWTIAWPLLWLILGAFVFLRQVPQEYQAIERGRQVLSLSVFAIMIAGMANIPAGISEDRERGLFLKLKSMPIQPWKESLGRVLAIIIFSIVSVILVFTTGILIGGRFDFGWNEFFISVPLLPLCMLVSAGIGMIVGTLIKNIQGSIMTGVGIAVVTSTVSGIFFPYEMLPQGLQKFSNYWPTSSTNNLLLYYMSGKAFLISSIGLHYAYTAIVSVVIFIAGILLYSKYGWQSE
ncbi:MAG: ABC transporter permease [Actinomycetota bacterium]